MEDYLASIPDPDHIIFSAVAKFAASLGYKPKKDKSKTLSYTFVHGQQKKTILRFSSNRGRPVIKVRYSASPEYSAFFHEAVRTVIEEYDYRYTGCYTRCDKCDGTQGYTYRYPDGRQYFRCGLELIDLEDIRSIPLPELFRLLESQHIFHLSEKEGA